MGREIRPHTVPTRLSDRELEMVKEINAKVGLLNKSEGVRYCISYTYLALVSKKKRRKK